MKRDLGVNRADYQEQGRDGTVSIESAPIEGPALADVLRRATPIGAPALTLGTTPLPLTCPAWRRSFSEPGESIIWHVENRQRGYVDLALEGHLEYDPEARRRLATLFVGPANRDGLPRFWPFGDPYADDLNLEKRNRSKVQRAVLTAVLSDLELPRVWRFESESPSDDAVPEDLSDARKLRAQGRLVLNRLGVWPWAHAEGGSLPYGWTGRSRVDQIAERLRGPLLIWHRVAVDALKNEVDRTGVPLGSYGPPG